MSAPKTRALDYLECDACGGCPVDGCASEAEAFCLRACTACEAPGWAWRDSLDRPQWWTDEPQTERAARAK